MIRNERFNLLDYLLFVLIIALFAVFSFIFQVNQIFSFDQTQMLVKGYHAALTGEYLPFGNEASTTGNLPGSLSSFVIGFPFSIYFHAYSPIFFQIFLRIIAVIFFANGLAQIFPKKIVLAGTFLFALSTWTLMQGMLYNPAYLPVGACAFFCAIAHLRNDNEANTSVVGRFLWSVLSVLGIGWCLQFHFSWPVLLFIAGIMWLRKDLKVSYVGLCVGAGLVALSLWPFIQELMVNPTLIRSTDAYSSDRYIGYGFVHVYPVFKGLLYWFRFGSLLFTQKAIVPEFDVDEIGLGLAIVAYAWIGISSLIGGITVIFAAYCNYFTIFKYRLSNHAGRLRFIRGLTFSSILAVLIAAGLNTLTLNYWQIAIVMPFALIPVLTYITHHQRAFKRYITLAVFFLAATNILAATYSSDYDIRVDYRKELYENCLTSFNQNQCKPLTEGLSSIDLDEAQKTKMDLTTILRVIDGIKPLPENADAEYVSQYNSARQNVRHYKFALPSEVTLGDPYYGQGQPRANMLENQVGKATGSNLEPKSEQTETKPQEQTQSQTQAQATPQAQADNKDSTAQAPADNKAPSTPNVEQAQGSITPQASAQDNSKDAQEQNHVKPANAPIESELPQSKSMQVRDEGQGSSGEIVLY